MTHRSTKATKPLEFFCENECGRDRIVREICGDKDRGTKVLSQRGSTAWEAQIPNQTVFDNPSAAQVLQPLNLSVSYSTVHRTVWPFLCSHIFPTSHQVRLTSKPQSIMSTVGLQCGHDEGMVDDGINGPFQQSAPIMGTALKPALEISPSE